MAEPHSEPDVFIQSRFSMSIATNSLHLQGVRFRISHYSDALYNQHQIHFPASLNNAVIKRKAEFLAGRLAARAACSGCRYAEYCHQIGIGPLRAPVWPDGISGSITHCCLSAAEGIALATSGHQNELLGIDLEKQMSVEMAAELAGSFASDEELALIRQTGQQAFYLTALFSAKESFFKALSPLIGQYFDFGAITLTSLSPGQLHFRVQHPECLTLLTQSDITIACYEFETDLLLTVAKFCIPA